MDIRVSITSLQMFEDCRQKWFYKYVEKWRARSGSGGSSAMNSGAAIAEGLEAGLLLETNVLKRVDTAKERALAYLTERQNTKLVPGVERALDAVPQWIWDIQVPVAEDKFEVLYEIPALDKYEDLWSADLIIVGKPDLWTIMNDRIKIIEFKSTGDSDSKAKSKLERYYYSPQPLDYAVLLRDTHPELAHLPLYTQHVLVTTRGSCFESEEHLVGARAYARAKDALLTRALETAILEPQRHFGVMCDWCEFKEACDTWRFGGDPQTALEFDFEKRA